MHREGSAGTRSWLEDRAADVLAIAGIPAPLVNVRVRIRGAEVRVLTHRAGPVERADSIELDMYWPAAGVCLEIDGPGHDRAMTRRQDAERDARLARVGITCARLTHRDVDRAERTGKLPAHVLAAFA